MLIAVFTLLCILSPALAYSRIYPPNDDDFAYDSIYDWRVRKDVRNPDIEAYLRQQVMYHIPSSLRRPPGHHHGWPPELSAPHHSLAQYQRQHADYASPSDFAVPPSDPRFFDPPRPILQNPPQHLFFGKDDVESKGPSDQVGRLEPNEKDLTTEKRTEPPVEVESSTSIQPEGEDEEEVVKTPLLDFSTTKENILLVALIAGSSTAAVSLVLCLVCGFLKLQKKAKDAADVEYPAYGVTGPNKEATPTGDRRLAHSAQMYHYQFTKQNIIAMGESSNRVEPRGSVSEADSEDDENEEGDYTVYECPGLAPTGEMEVTNPLYQDETTPAPVDQKPKE